MEATQSHHHFVQVSGGSNNFRSLVIQRLIKCYWAELEVVLFTLCLCKAQCSVDTAGVSWFQIDEWDSLNSGGLELITFHNSFHEATPR